MIITKKKQEEEIIERFEALVRSGLNITQATEQVMREFNILAPMTIYNIRKRHRKDNDK